VEAAKYSRFFCAQPFVNASVDGNGDVFLCCAAFLNESAGNVLERPFPEVWNSEAAQDLRRTILDGTYSHCVAARCPFLQQEVLLQTKEEITDPVLRDIIDTGKIVLETGPRELHAAYDTTCNLACPYCRSDYIALKGEELGLAERIHERVVDGALGITQTLVVSSQGDPFASKLYSKILRDFDPVKFPQLRMRMTTNGMLFTPENWESIRASHGALQHIHVSVNGASKESFEANQKGASWEKLLENLDFISRECRQNGEQKRFVTLSFIVQKNNYREMPDFVRLVQRFGFDRAHFGMIFHADRTYSDEEFVKLPVHWANHPEHQEFQRIMCDPLLRAPEVLVVGALCSYLPHIWHYFGYHAGAAPSGAAFWRPEGVDWRGWASALGLADMQGVSTPRMIAFSPPTGSAPGPISFVQFCALLGLDGQQETQARDELNELRAAVATLFAAPAAEGQLAPLVAAAEDVTSGRAATPREAVAQLFTHAAASAPAGARMSYGERFARTELDYRERLYRMMEPRQRRAYLALPITSLFDIDTGHDPLMERLRAHVLERGGVRENTSDRVSWAVFSAYLGLGQQEDADARGVLRDFKEKVAALFAEAPAGGGPPPLALIAASLRPGETGASAALDTLLREQAPARGGRAYGAQIGELDERSRATLAEIVPPATRNRLYWLPVRSLMSVELPGADPVGAAVGAYIAADRARAMG
jgi:MoaA/NifB/PqqE/SkfB family radical SAM enzyme